VIYVAPGQVHAFERQRTRRPLCLVIDIALDPDRPMSRSVTRLNATELTRIRARLSSLFGLREFDPATMVLQLGAVILDVLDPSLAGLGYLGETRPAAPPAHITHKVERALASIERENEDWTLRDLAKRLGYQQDYLNRQLKAECGLTLGQLRARSRLEKAQRLLRDRSRSIADVAEAIGLLDNNYFARWFKQQTGLTPSAWRAG
ncbi:MAG: helix-turn-helix transcriptional regulator, partial [Verrucomicrobiales bacterium]